MSIITDYHKEVKHFSEKNKPSSSNGTEYPVFVPYTRRATRSSSLRDGIEYNSTNAQGNTVLFILPAPRLKICHLPGKAAGAPDGVHAGHDSQNDKFYLHQAVSVSPCAETVEGGRR